jgi:drug/metabolite transporter (DMT)-like permease
MESLQGDASSIEQAKTDDSTTSDEYKKGIAIISFITLLNASLAPVWHTVFAGGEGPPPLFLNAVVSVTALIGLLAFGPFLDGKVETTSALAEKSENAWSAKSFRGGMELGFWKGLGESAVGGTDFQRNLLCDKCHVVFRGSFSPHVRVGSPHSFAGTTCHIYGMALTTANHGAFLLQMTTLIVPVVQGLRGAEKIPQQIQWAVILALVGITAFTQDPNGAASVATIDETSLRIGDALVLGAAAFYSAYDIQTFYWGREVPRNELVTIKIGFQAVLSIVLCAVASRTEVLDYLSSNPDWFLVVPTILWSGLIVNALATFLQVGGMQSVGPTRAQTIFASQPLWASIMNFVFLGETMGLQGLLGGGSFLGALFLAATAEAPLPKVENEKQV